MNVFSLGTIIASTRPLLLKSQAFYFQVMVPVSLTLTPLFTDSFFKLYFQRKKGRDFKTSNLHQHPVPVKSSKGSEKKKNHIFPYWLGAQRFNSDCRPWRKCLPLHRQRGQMSLVLPAEGSSSGAKTQLRQAALVLSLPGWRHLLFASMVTAPNGAFSSTFTCTSILNLRRCASAYM